MYKFIVTNSDMKKKKDSEVNKISFQVSTYKS